MVIDEANFPHYCKVYKMVGEDAFTDGEEVVFYEGVCRDQGNSAMRTYTQNGVMKADHALFIPKFLKGITNDCMLDMRNDCVEVKRLLITSCQPVRYGVNRRTGEYYEGTTIMYNEPKN